MQKATMSVKEASKYLGISIPLMYQLTEIEGFPILRVGKRKLILAEEFQAWLVKNCNGEPLIRQ